MFRGTGLASNLDRFWIEYYLSTMLRTQIAKLVYNIYIHTFDSTNTILIDYT